MFSTDFSVNKTDLSPNTDTKVNARSVLFFISSQRNRMSPLVKFATKLRLFHTQTNGMVAPTQNGINVPKCGECKFPLTERGDHNEDYNNRH